MLTERGVVAGTMADHFQIGAAGPTVSHGDPLPDPQAGTAGDLYLRIGLTPGLYIRQSSGWRRSNDRLIGDVRQVVTQAGATTLAHATSYVAVNVAAGTILTMMAGMPGKTVVIKDEGGRAASHGITIVGQSGDTIGGNINRTINIDYGAMTLVYGEAEWHIVAVVPTIAPARGPKPVDLRSAGGFTILTQTGITNVAPSAITGTVGCSPVTGAALLLTCAEVSGAVYCVDAAGPAPCAVAAPTLLSAAIADMHTAYADAAGRTAADFLELGAGEIGGLTLAPGLYRWSTGLQISTDVTLAGNPHDVWLFQINGPLTQAGGTHINFSNGTQAKNVFWQVAGAVSIGAAAQFAGIILGQTSIAVQTGATISGRLLAQTAVSLQINSIAAPV